MRHSVKDITHVVFDFVAPEQLEKFFPKVRLLVMVVLVAYVFNYGLFLTLADTECGVSLLP